MSEFLCRAKPATLSGEEVLFCCAVEKGGRMLATGLSSATVTVEKAPRGTAAGRRHFTVTVEKALRIPQASQLTVEEIPQLGNPSR